MKRKRKTFGLYVAVPQAVMDAKAWRVMSLGARLLNIQLRRRLRNDRLNNGRIYESCRSAAQKMGVNKDSIALFYAENEHYGFLRKTAEGFLGCRACTRGYRTRIDRYRFFLRQPTARMTY
jgi:predicted xylose isomerase-like sugar epimerase